MPRLKDYYTKEIVPKMKEKFNISNDLRVPKIDKVVLNIGTGAALKDAKILDSMITTLRTITGQNPIKTKSKKAISGFGIREDQVVGLKVTLRKDKMYEFLDKLINMALPRVRDFRGISPDSFDKQGNYSIGLKEQIVFPEIRTDEVSHIHGLEINISTTTDNVEEARELLKLFGFPFKEN